MREYFQNLSFQFSVVDFSKMPYSSFTDQVLQVYLSREITKHREQGSILKGVVQGWPVTLEITCAHLKNVVVAVVIVVAISSLTCAI